MTTPDPSARVRTLIIILNYRVTALTIDCLRSLAPEVAGRNEVRVAVCENGTGGDAEQRLRAAIAESGWDNWVDLTAVWPNRGFTGGNNIIIREAMQSASPPDYFLLLNADTLVHPDAIHALVRFMDEHSGVGVAGSRLELADGSQQSSPFRFWSITSEFDRGLRLGVVSKALSRWKVAMAAPAQAQRVDWVSGASMIIRREVIEQIGPLDEGLYTYFDDIDYCLNAKRVGWETWFVPQSRVIHLEGASTGIVARSIKRRPDYWFQARRRFLLKNYGPIYTALADAAFLAGFALWRLRRRVQGKPDLDPPYFLLDSWRNSVFLTGFAVRAVENPAMRQA